MYLYRMSLLVWIYSVDQMNRNDTFSRAVNIAVLINQNALFARHLVVADSNTMRELDRVRLHLRSELSNGINLESQRTKSILSTTILLQQCMKF